MRPAGVLWGPPLLLAVLAAALLPGANAQTFGRTSQVITVPTVAYISFAVVGVVLLIIMLLLKYRASVWRRREAVRVEKAEWEAANALREVHIPPLVLNPDCSLGLAEPDKQLAVAAAGSGAATQPGCPEQPQQPQPQATQPIWRRGERQQRNQQQQGQQGQPAQQGRQHSQRMQGRPSVGVELQQLPPAVQQPAPRPGEAAWPGATVYVRGSRAAFASASIQAPLV
ncbi:hypothetical protein COHA_005116 [Chlorella ohadii]|uniref:Uncharacterized protein n=1 Tax=Chlorella ohadii TaxID=2649997 RepID=A0AAD5DRK5_9CHLO|nr:hypothetical protein COHA_005116 [Chlorella ohadii]